MPDITTLAEVAEIPFKDGAIRVSVRDAGHGPAVDVRQWYAPRGGGELRPSKVGFWLNTYAMGAAESLAEAIASAVAAALELEPGAGIIRHPACGEPRDVCVCACERCGRPVADCLAGDSRGCNPRGGSGGPGVKRADPNRTEVAA